MDSLYSRQMLASATGSTTCNKPYQLLKGLAVIIVASTLVKKLL
jgi:hypothetical protein